MITRRAVNLGGGGCAALVFLLMSFSYGPTSSPPTSNPQIDYPRLLISDTQELDANGNQIYIFQDQEILNMYAIAQANFQSSQFYSPPGGVGSYPNNPISYLRVAAYLLNSVAANKARLASIKKLLDVQLDSSDASIQLRDTAQMYLDMDDNAGAFAIIEQCQDYFSFRDRFWKQVQRQSGA